MAGKKTIVEKKKKADGVSAKIPEGITAALAGNEIVLRKGNDEGRQGFDSKKMAVEVKGNEVVIVPVLKGKRATTAAMQSIVRHIGNMVAGMTTPYEKKLEIVYAHFPVAVEVKGSKVMIKNFLGEKNPREANIVGKTQVIVSGQQIAVTGINKEEVGQTAANIRQATKIVGKDCRVFQDGIYYGE